MFQQVAADDGAPVPTGATLDRVATTRVVPRPNKRDDFTVTVGALGVAYDETARRFFLSRRADVTVNAQAAVLGSDERQFGVQSISFERAGLRISVAGTAPRSVLLDATQSVHVATGDELASVARRRARRRPAPTTRRRPPRPSQVAGDHLSSGEPYSVDGGPGDRRPGQPCSSASVGAVREVTSLTPHDSYIATVASPTMTALVAFVAPAIDDARLVVAIGDPAAPTTIVGRPGGAAQRAARRRAGVRPDAAVRGVDPHDRRRARCPSSPAERDVVPPAPARRR